ncbi:MAG: hypothetical protein M3O46_12935, partial [Myxococcota bacterium]|nr:hypothetical protein [Myxococcota bacterium]
IGPGFPMGDARGRPLIVALSGTGVAAGRPIVRRRIAEDDAERTQVLVGIRRRGELPTRGDLEAWIQAGVDVLVCLSKDDGPIEGIRYAHGYVQDVLREGKRTLSLESGHIFAVGMSSMIDALKALSPELGVPRGHVHTNH